MVMEFGQYIVDIDVEKTRDFYKNAMPVSEGCSCDGCMNFEKAVGVLPLPVRTFFAALGIDMRKVCECYVNCRNDDGTLSYGGFYHVCGTLLAGKSAWKNIDNNLSACDKQGMFSVAPDFNVSFEKEIHLLEADFPRPVIQLEFFANIPWVLEKENTYQ